MIRFSRYFDIINGSNEDFKLEHRIFNMMLFFSIFLCFQSSVFNYTLELNNMAVISPFLCGVILIFSYYLSRVKMYYTLPVTTTFAVVLYVLLPILWISNGGINGGTVFYIFLFATMIGIVSLRRDIKFTFTVSMFVIVGVLIYIDISNPQIIQGYQNEAGRISDLTWGIFVTLLALILITEAFIISYTKERLKNEKYTMLIEEQKKEIQYKNDILEKLNSSLNEKIEYTEDLYKNLLEEIILYDELTGLYNRREIIRMVTEKVQDFHISNQKFTVAKLDIDHFKEINDKYGISMGDELLTEISFILKNQFSDAIPIGRYGGEEFLLIFTETDMDKIYERLEEFRVIVKKKEFTHNKITVTISGYIEVYEGQKYKNYLESLDKNLHKSKRLGNDIIFK